MALVAVAVAVWIQGKQRAELVCAFAPGRQHPDQYAPVGGCRRVQSIQGPGMDQRLRLVNGRAHPAKEIKDRGKWALARLFHNAAHRCLTQPGHRHQAHP